MGQYSTKGGGGDLDPFRGHDTPQRQVHKFQKKWMQTTERFVELSKVYDRLLPHLEAVSASKGKTASSVHHVGKKTANARVKQMVAKARSY